MKNKKVLDSPRLLEIKKRKREILNKKIYIFIVLFSIALVGFIFISRWQKVNISEIKISGNKILESSELKSFVEKELVGNYLYVFPKTNILFYPKKNIGKKLLENFKRIATTLVYISSDNILNIVISERDPAYTWCGTNPEEDETTEQCYFMDKNGYLFDKSPYFSEEVYVKFYGDIKDKAEPLGYFFAPEIFTNLISFKESISNKLIKPSSFYVKNEENETSMFLASSGVEKRGPEVLLDTKSLPGNVAENLQTVISTEPLRTDFAKKYDQIKYIDLRFGNKVYYKLK